MLIINYLKIALVAFFFVTVFRNDDDKNEMDDDGDDQQEINKYKKTGDVNYFNFFLEFSMN